MLKHWVRRVDLDPGKRPLLAAQRQPEGTGVRGYTAGNAPRGSMVCLGNEMPLLSGVEGVGGTIVTPFPMCHLLPPQALGGTPTRASTSQSVTISCWFLMP